MVRPRLWAGTGEGAPVWRWISLDCGRPHAKSGAAQPAQAGPALANSIRFAADACAGARCTSYATVTKKQRGSGAEPTAWSRRRRADHHVIAVWIAERKFGGAGIRAHVGILLEGTHVPGPNQCFLEVVDTEEQ